VNQQVTEVKDHVTIAETERSADLLAWQVRVRQTYGYLPSQVPQSLSVIGAACRLLRLIGTV